MNGIVARGPTEESELKRLVELFKGDANLLKVIGIAWLSYGVFYNPRDLGILQMIEESCKPLKSDQ